MAAASHVESGAALELCFGPAEYACPRRLYHRMILSYLSEQGLKPTFQSLVRRTDAYLCVEHLRGLVAGGPWGEALEYLGCFLPPGAGGNVEARPVILFLHVIWAFENIAGSARHGGAVTSDTHRRDFTVCLSVRQLRPQAPRHPQPHPPVAAVQRQPGLARD